MQTKLPINGTIQHPDLAEAPISAKLTVRSHRRDRRLSARVSCYVGSRRKGLKQMLEFIIGLVIGAGVMYAAFKFGYLKL
jgi:hypothetical protein